VQGQPVAQFYGLGSGWVKKFDRGKICDPKGTPGVGRKEGSDVEEGRKMKEERTDGRKERRK
jgi:hypothetical protein